MTNLLAGRRTYNQALQLEETFSLFYILHLHYTHNMGLASKLGE